jgi:hypothetical protein
MAVSCVALAVSLWVHGQVKKEAETAKGLAIIATTELNMRLELDATQAMLRAAEQELDELRLRVGICDEALGGCTRREVVWDGTTYRLMPTLEEVPR